MMSKPYRPSNGSEGADFFDTWCRRCARDKAMREGADFDECDWPALRTCTRHPLLRFVKVAITDWCNRGAKMVHYSSVFCCAKVYFGAIQPP